MLLHEDNQGVVYILNSMVSASKVMMAELRQLEVLMRVLGVKIEARWIPSAVNKFADALSRTWDPGDARATDALVSSIQKEFGLSHVAFRTRPLGDTLIARKKYLATQMNEDWGDGKARLWNPPFDLLPLVVSKIEAEGGRGVLVAPKWPAQAWFARLRALSCRMTSLDPGDHDVPLFEGERSINPGWGLVIAEVT